MLFFNLYCIKNCNFVENLADKVNQIMCQSA